MRPASGRERAALGDGPRGAWAVERWLRFASFPGASDLAQASSLCRGGGGELVVSTQMACRFLLGRGCGGRSDFGSASPPPRVVLTYTRGPESLIREANLGFERREAGGSRSGALLARALP